MLDHCFHCHRRLWRNDKEEEEEKAEENDKVIYKNGIGEKGFSFGWYSKIPVE